MGTKFRVLLDQLSTLSDNLGSDFEKEAVELSIVVINILEEKLELAERKAQFADSLFERMMRDGWRAPSDTNIMGMMADAGYGIPEEEEGDEE